MFAAVSVRDLDRFFATLAPDCVVRTDRAWPGGGEFRGTAAIAGFVDEFLSAFSSIHFEEDAEPVLTASGVTMRGHWIGSGAASGIETESFHVTVRIEADELLTELDFRFA